MPEVHVHPPTHIDTDTNNKIDQNPGPALFTAGLMKVPPRTVVKGMGGAAQWGSRVEGLLCTEGEGISGLDTS